MSNRLKTGSSDKILRMTQLAILTAIVILLQCFVTFVKLPFLPTSFNLALIPIALGAILLGPRAGAWLGFVCGAVVLICGVAGADIFTHLLFELQPLMTVAICLVKTTVAGLLAGLAFPPLSKETHWGALFATAAIVPVVNTGIFILGSFIIKDAVIEVGRQLEIYTEGMSIIAYVFVVLVTVNFFFFELIPCLALTPAMERIVYAIKKK